MRALEALCLSAGLGAAVLLAESLGALLAEPHYLDLLGPGSQLRGYLAGYCATFLGLGLLGWLLGAGLRLARPSSRPAWVLVPGLLALPLIAAPLEFRSALAERVGQPLGIAVLAALAAVLVGASLTLDRPERVRRAARLGAMLLPMLAAANAFVLQQLPSQLLTGAVALRLLAAIGFGAAVGLPFAWALRGAGERPVTARLALTGLVAAALVLGGDVAVARSRSAPLEARLRECPSADRSALLVVVDTLRADFVTGYGPGGVTPHVEAFTRDAVLFRNAWAASPWTTPSFASILSSEYPGQHRAGQLDPRFGFKRAMREDVESLAHVLGGAGWWTGSVLTNPSVSRRYRLDQGFDDYRNLLTTRWYHPVGYALQRPNVLLARRTGLRLLPRGKSYVQGPSQTRRILGGLARACASGRPFLVLAHYMDPHGPYAPPAEHVVAGENPRGVPEDGYRGEVRWFDASFGDLVDTLQRVGLYDPMLIVLTSDHGEELGEARGRGAHGHGHTLFDEQLRIPLIVKRAGGEGSGGVRDDTASHVDVAPTLAAALGVERAERWQGRDLFAATAEAAPVIAEGMLIGAPQRAAMAEPYKLWARRLPVAPETTVVFDRSDDPGEQRPLPLGDVAGSKQVQRLYERLRAEPDPDPEAGAGDAGVVPDPILREQLEALGYTQ